MLPHFLKSEFVFYHREYFFLAVAGKRSTEDVSLRTYAVYERDQGKLSPHHTEVDRN